MLIPEHKPEEEEILETQEISERAGNHLLAALLSYVPAPNTITKHLPHSLLQSP